MTVATTRLATYGQLMRIRLVVLAISVLLLIPAVARASLGDEQLTANRNFAVDRTAI